jgi:ABC-type amino acid transport substrate-binding protein
MRWLLVKDLQILRRSPLLAGLLVAYPIALALMIGVAMSSPPGKPRVAFYDAVAHGEGRLHLGSQVVNITGYAHDLFSAIRPVRVGSQAQAVAAVRAGRALAALVIPADIPAQLESLIENGVGSPTVRLYLNARDPLERAYVESVIDRRISAVQAAVSKQVLRVAVSDLQKVLRGGTLSFAGASLHLLGLRASRAIVARAAGSLPRGAPLRRALRAVISFATVAIEGLTFAGPTLGSIGSPLTVQQIQLSGRTTPAATYAVTIAVVVSLMFVALLLAAAMLALERSEHVYTRLVRGLVRPRALIGEKALLAGGAAVLVGLMLSALTAPFAGLDWGRFELWLVALVFAAGAFASLGVLIGALARELAPASLLAFLVALPIAFIALVPTSAVSSTVATLLSVLSFVFPFRSALQALGSAFAATSPPILLSLLHLTALAALFLGLARVAMRRFAS